MSSPIPRVNRLYAQPDPSAKTNCHHANTGLPHNPACPCGWARPPQTVPYMEPDYPETDFPPSPYGDL